MPSVEHRYFAPSHHTPSKPFHYIMLVDFVFFPPFQNISNKLSVLAFAVFFRVFFVHLHFCCSDFPSILSIIYTYNNDNTRARSLSRFLSHLFGSLSTRLPLTIPGV